MWRKVPALVLFLLIPVLTGCWDRRELEEYAFVLAIGLDRGEVSPFAVTFMIARPEKMAGGEKGGGGEKPYLLTTVEAPTVPAAVSMVNSTINRRVSLLHTKSLLMGEALARESGMQTMDEFARYREARRSITYIVTRGKASEFFEQMDPKIEGDPNKFLTEMSATGNYTGMLPIRGQVNSFVTHAHTGYVSPITYYASLKEEEKDSQGRSGEKKDSGFVAGELPRKGGPNLEMIGAAAFRRDRMTGVLNGEEVRMVLMLKDQFRRGYFSIPDPGGPDQYVSLSLERSRPTLLVVERLGERPRIRARVRLEAEVMAIQSRIDYTDPARQPELERALEAELTRMMREVIAKTQAWESDVAGFGREVVRHFPTVAAWEEYDWPGRYRNTEVVPEVEVTLRRFGLQLSPPNAID